MDFTYSPKTHFPKIAPSALKVIPLKAFFSARAFQGLSLGAEKAQKMSKRVDNEPKTRKNLKKSRFLTPAERPREPLFCRFFSEFSGERPSVKIGPTSYLGPERRTLKTAQKQPNKVPFGPFTVLGKQPKNSRENTRSMQNSCFSAVWLPHNPSPEMKFL